eukprot:TRINITY_DN4132_c0_g1_i1.p2 TRINITY_DN4132_c0_g1~~TRINITY_DN4132_c0_g1_i1.p2  ORF type:complete len:181 (-),score=80.28 TRINITY_DN4132_c0_g1_i1:56-598(-)
MGVLGDTPLPAPVTWAEAGGDGGDNGGVATTASYSAHAAQPLSLKLKKSLKTWNAESAVTLATRCANEFGIGEVSVEADVDSFVAAKNTNGGTAVLALCDPTTVLLPLSMALQQIATDDLGREALGESLHAIRIVNDDSASTATCQLSSGTLSIRLQLSRGPGPMLSEQTIVKFIESQLE